MNSPRDSRPDEGWTLETLRIHLQRQLDDLRILLGERFEAAATAVAKAETANERRFDSVNEFRAQLSDQAGTFLARNEYTVQHDALESKVDALDRRTADAVNLLNSRLDTLQGQAVGAADWRSRLALAIGAVVSIIGVVVALYIATRK